ncbi:MAG: general secretion pathway protein GspK [Opitutaceae bacterium]|nr:general secretion pathway protein GspK [Opitutaceae bacterium]
MVLVTLLLASFMVLKFIESSSLDLLLAARKADRFHLRDDAYAALELALAVIAEVKAIDGDTLNAPAQGWGDPYAYAGMTPREGVTVEFTFEDESGKLSLPQMDQNKLILLCEKLDMRQNDAQRFADAFLSWSKADYNGVNFDSVPTVYEREELPHKVPQRSPRSWEEFAAIAVVRDFLYDENGQLTPFAEAFRQNISLYSFSDTNINAACPASLLMAGMDDTQIARLQQFNAGETRVASGNLPFFRDVKEAGVIVQGVADYQNFGASIHCLRITVTVREDVATTRLQVLLALDSDVSLPEAFAAPTSSTSSATIGYWGTGATSASSSTGNTGTNNRNNNRTGNTGSRQTSGNTSTGTTATTATSVSSTAVIPGPTTQQQALNYPFTFLEIHEDSGPPPAPRSDLEAPRSDSSRLEST